MQAACLPQLLCLKSVKNNKFLRYKNDISETRGLLQFTGDVMDSLAQFEVLESKIGNGLVHLKCRYTDLYLVRWSRSHYWISASAYEPEEDPTNWNCTLFKPVVVEGSGNTGQIRLLHVQLRRYVRLQSDNVSPSYVSCLLADSKEPDVQNSFDLLTTVDWESLFKLPKRVAFKGDNGFFLGAQLFNGQPGLQFSFKDAMDPKVAHEITPSSGGSIYIMSEYHEKYWRVGNKNWIYVDSDGPDGCNNCGTVTFRVNPVDMNVVALLCTNPTSFLKRLNNPNINDGFPESIAAATQTIDPWARLQIVDLDKLVKN